MRTSKSKSVPARSGDHKRRMPSNTRWTGTGLGTLVHRAGYSLEALAESTGYTATFLRFVFVGRRLPTVELLLRLRTLLGVDGDTLLEATRPQIREHLLRARETA